MNLSNKTRAPLNFSNLFWITFVHLGAIAAIPFFTWNRLWALLVGVFILAPLGVNFGFHRLLTHRSCRSPKWLSRTLASLGAALGGGAPVHWVAQHRIHHRFSDQVRDPHNSYKGFWYSHIGHLFFVNKEETEEGYLEKYAPDLLADPYMAWLNKHWLFFALATLPLTFAMGGIGMVLWAVFLRLAVMWHIMWFVNSASHMWGYRNYETHDRTKNCWWVGLLAAGEGWHNNHHAFPNCAAHGRKWWELDLTYLIIRGLERVSLLQDVKHPENKKLPENIEDLNAATLDHVLSQPLQSINQI